MTARLVQQQQLLLLQLAIMVPACLGLWSATPAAAEATSAASVSSPQPDAAGAANHPPGHMRPLGSHAAPAGDVPSLAALPSPDSFFREFVSPGRPVLFRGAASRMPAFALWADDAYLRRRYGELEVSVELGKKENRSAGVYSSSLDRFLASFSREDIYMVQSLPEAMRGEVWLPSCLACGGLQRSLVDSVLWLSSGGTKSVLHYDSLDNVICVLAGSKSFFMADKEELARLALDHEDEAFLGVDVDRVDMYLYPGLRHLRWYRATAHAGDCFFIPYKWLHQVNSAAGRSLAVNFWFVHLHWFNRSDCETTRASDSPPSDGGVPLSDYQMASTLELLRAQVLEDFEGRDVVTLAELQDWTRGRGQTKAGGTLARLFEAGDKDGDGALTMEELYAVPAEMFAALLGITGDSKTDERVSTPLPQASPPRAQARTSDEL